MGPEETREETGEELREDADDMIGEETDETAETDEMAGETKAPKKSNWLLWALLAAAVIAAVALVKARLGLF